MYNWICLWGKKRILKFCSCAEKNDHVNPESTFHVSRSYYKNLLFAYLYNEKIPSVVCFSSTSVLSNIILLFTLFFYHDLMQPLKWCSPHTGKHLIKKEKTFPRSCSEHTSIRIYTLLITLFIITCFLIHL